MPRGTAMTAAAAVMIKVPMIAGPMPGPGSRDRAGMFFVRNDQLMTPAPRPTTVAMTAMSGMATTTSDNAIKIDMMLLFVDRQVRVGRRRAATEEDTAVSVISMALIAIPGYAGPNVAPQHWRACSPGS